MVYSVLFNTVIEALNLILEKYVAEIQLPGNIIQFSPYHRFYTEF
jgi:hypothetical protein